jgi:hypothetical protein
MLCCSLEVSAIAYADYHLAHRARTQSCTLQDMSWSKFYCFVSGQQAGRMERVLLHGAMDVSPQSASSVSRRSAEMRFSIFLAGGANLARLAIPPSQHDIAEAFSFDDL